MKTKLSILLLLIPLFALAQSRPELNIGHSRLLAVYDFVEKLGPHYPENEFKKLFNGSPYNTPRHNKLLNRLNSLDLYASYKFEGFPEGQRAPVTSIDLLKRNMIHSETVDQFKTLSFGVVPNSELLPLCELLRTFDTVYEELIWKPRREAFEAQLTALKNYVENSDLDRYFELGLSFYNSSWDPVVPIDITILPTLEGGAFTATAFLNQAVSEVPLDFNYNDVLFSVLMHEIYHNLYNEQSAAFKTEMATWFTSNSSPNRQYAFLLLNEALATAAGNGYVYESLTGKVDAADWYYKKDINAMAKKIYPMVKEYMDAQQAIDKNFVTQYIDIYDKYFSTWKEDPQHYLTYRYLLAENEEDLEWLRSLYPYASIEYLRYPIDQKAIEEMMQKPITKVLEVKNRHQVVKDLFSIGIPELSGVEFPAGNDFVKSIDLKDGTKLILIFSEYTSANELFTNSLLQKAEQ